MTAGSYVDMLTGSMAAIDPAMTTLAADAMTMRLYVPASSACATPAH